MSLDSIFDRIADEVGNYRRSDLLALAPTHRRFARPCQRNPLSNLQRDTPQFCHRLFLSFMHNPDLATYVTVLALADDLNENWIMYDEALPVLLRIMNNFTKRCFTLSSEDAMDYESDDEEEDESEDKIVGNEIVWRQRWNYLPQETQAAFMQIFSLPSQRQLSVAELSDIPMSLEPSETLNDWPC